MNKFKKNEKSKLFQEIFGLHAVTAALQNPKRQHFELNIIKKYSNLASNLKKKIKNIKIYNNKDFFKKFGNQNINQGIVLKSTYLKQQSFEDFLISEKKNSHSLILILDQITDTQNIGSILRSCSLFGCRGIIVAKNNSPEITSNIIKSASGAVEDVNYIKVTNINRIIKTLKKNKYWIYGLDHLKERKKLSSLISLKTVFVLGSENSGIRDLIKKECDDIISLPFKPNNKYKIDSLNVSNAASIAMYEYFTKYFS